MSKTSFTTTASNKNDSNHDTNNDTNNNDNKQKLEEEILRTKLLTFSKELTRREPLDPYYNLDKITSVKPPRLHPPDELYASHDFTADLRERVESYMSRYGTETPVHDARKTKIGRCRPYLDPDLMRAAFTLRENKPYEQDGLVQGELQANRERRLNGWFINEGERKRRVEAMACGLQEKERKRRRDGALLAAARNKMLLDAEKATLEKRRALAQNEEEAAVIEEKLRQKEKEGMVAKRGEMEEQVRLREIEIARIREQKREKERLIQQREERRRLQREREEAARTAIRNETAQQTLHRFYEPMFTALWDMEFYNDYFTGANPFRTVINKENCASMGAPDYCDVIQKPMNLTYVREKVSGYKYETLQDFLNDIELIISNALLYNSDLANPYHKAANIMKNEYLKLRKKVIKSIEGQSS